MITPVPGTTKTRTASFELGTDEDLDDVRGEHEAQQIVVVDSCVDRNAQLGVARHGLVARVQRRHGERQRNEVVKEVEVEQTWRFFDAL